MFVFGKAVRSLKKERLKACGYGIKSSALLRDPEMSTTLLLPGTNQAGGHGAVARAYMG